jgi:hypothetical protein
MDMRQNTAETITDSSTDHLRATVASRCRPGQLLPGIDGRSAWTRRCRDVLAAHLSDTPDASAAERSIIRRASVLTVELERMERQFALNEQASPDELDAYQRCANSLRRLLEAVGLQRRARDVGPSLGDLLRADQRQEGAHG